MRSRGWFRIYRGLCPACKNRDQSCLVCNPNEKPTDINIKRWQMTYETILKMLYHP